MLPSGCCPILRVARGVHDKALWDPTRIQLFYGDSRRWDFVDKADLGTGVEGSLKATLRELGVFLVFFKIYLF